MNILDFFILSERRDAFVKSLEDMRYPDLAIHRKLGEASGLTYRYIIPARGGGKSLLNHEWVDEEEETDTTPTTYKWTEAIMDQDILGWDDATRRTRAERLAEELCKIYRRNDMEDMCNKIWISSVNPYINHHLSEELHKAQWRDWYPIVHQDAYIFDGKNACVDINRDTLIYGGFKDAARELINELEGAMNDR